MRHELCCYDYVNHPFEAVQAALVGDAGAVLAHPGALHVAMGGMSVVVEITVTVGSVAFTKASGRPAIAIDLAWTATRNPARFPHLTGVLTCFPLTPTETQLELRASYTPPLGLAGEVLDALALHRIAEAAGTNFIRDLAGHLRRTLARSA